MASTVSKKSKKRKITDSKEEIKPKASANNKPKQKKSNDGKSNDVKADVEVESDTSNPTVVIWNYILHQMSSGHCKASQGIFLGAYSTEQKARDAWRRNKVKELNDDYFQKHKGDEDTFVYRTNFTDAQLKGVREGTVRKVEGDKEAEMWAGQIIAYLD